MIKFFLKLLTILVGLFKYIPILNKMDVIRNIEYFLAKKMYTYKGVEIGDGSVLYNVTLSSSSKGDKFIIGNHCTLTGCTLLAHDASPSLFIDELNVRSKPWLFGARRSYRNTIIIGDNVFIGYGAIILPGVTINSNVIVSAGSVVTKNLDSGYVYGGNPVRRLKSIVDFDSKYRELYFKYPERF